MHDLISRQAAIDAMNTRLEDIKLTWRGKVKKGEIAMYLDMRGVIETLPSAQPERNTAEWIYGEKDGADGWYCSKCGFHVPWYYEYYGLNNINFIKDFHTCPHCDAKMLKYTGMEREQNG